MNRKRFVKAFLFIILSICSTITVNGIVAMGTSNKEDVKIYIASEMENYQTTINISDYEIKYVDITSIMREIFNEYPNLFYVKDVYDYSYDDDNNVYSIEIQYIDSKDNIEAMKEKYEYEINKAISYVENSMTDAQKALVVHDYLALCTEYDYENYVKKDIPYASYTTYGALVDKKAVCLGYARAYKEIMNRLGMECEIVSSKKMNHAWNVVKVDGQYLNVDVTKDDVVYDTLGYVSHRKFLLSDKAMREEDYEVEDTKYNISSAKYDNYFWRNVNTAILYNNGRWYYSYGGKVFSYDFGKQTSNEIYNATKHKWYVLNSKNYYASFYNKIAMSSDKIIFSTSNAVYEMNFNEDIRKIYELKRKDGYIYGIAFVDNELYCHIKKKPNDEGIKIKTGINRGMTSYEAKDDKDSSIKDSGSSLKNNQSNKDIINKNNDTKLNDNKENSKDNVDSNNDVDDNNETKKTTKKDYKSNDKIKLSSSCIHLLEGGNASLKVYTEDRCNLASWSSSDDSVANVNSCGVVCALSEGVATIECKIDSVVLECIVKVQVNKIQRKQYIQKIDYENSTRKKKWYMYRVPRVCVKQSCFVKRARKSGKGLKIERICKRVLKRTSGIYM